MHTWQFVRILHIMQSITVGFSIGMRWCSKWCQCHGWCPGIQHFFIHACACLHECLMWLTHNWKHSKNSDPWSNWLATVVKRCFLPSKTDFNLLLNDENLFCERNSPISVRVQGIMFEVNFIQCPSIVAGPMALESNVCGPVRFNPVVCCVTLCSMKRHQCVQLEMF